MIIQALLNQFDMGDSDPAERARRVAACLDALRTGHEVRGIFEGRVTTICLGNDGQYVVTQTWTITGESSGGSADLVADDPGADDILDDNFGVRNDANQPH